MLEETEEGESEAEAREEEPEEENLEAGKADKGETVHVACRNCSSLTAYMKKLNAQLTRYECTECGKRRQHKSATSFNV